MSSFKVTNNHDISAALSVFLLHDSYDHDPRPNSISATTLLKPIRQIVLMRQNAELDKQVDLMDLVASSMGTALHSAVEAAWKDPATLNKAMELWRIPENMRDKIKVNPESISEDEIAIYLENREEIEVGSWIVLGKYDLVLNGILEDIKSTSVWSYIFDSNAKNYSLQGSIYKWLSPNRITSDYVNIHYIFTDWSKAKSMQDSSYPPHRVMTKKYPLMTVEETDNWIKQRLSEIDRNIDLPQSHLPECSDEELWATETEYKYYKNPDKKSRATKKFSSLDEAMQRLGNDGNVGEVVTVPGQVKACRYCPVLDICEQRKRLEASGRLLL